MNFSAWLIKKLSENVDNLAIIDGLLSNQESMNVYGRMSQTILSFNTSGVIKNVKRRIACLHWCIAQAAAFAFINLLSRRVSNS